MKAARCLWAAGLVLAVTGAAPASGQSTTPMYGDSTVEPTPESPWSWIKLPKITMPKITMPKMPTDPFAPIKASAHKVSDGTKRMWEGTKELFTFGGSKTADEPAERVASRPEQPSVWKRMFGGAEEPEPPQTVADWMAQKRVE